jgi:hypothetical protein
VVWLGLISLIGLADRNPPHCPIVWFWFVEFPHCLVPFIRASRDSKPPTQGPPGTHWLIPSNPKERFGQPEPIYPQPKCRKPGNYEVKIIYFLVNLQSYGKSQCFTGKPTMNGNLSVTMWVYQRVPHVELLSSSDPHPEALFWHSFWHILWYSFWRSIWHIFLTFFLACILTFFLAFSPTFCLTLQHFIRHPSWHSIWHSRRIPQHLGLAWLRSIQEGGEGEEGDGEEGEQGRWARSYTVIHWLKSRDPHLAGGEKTQLSTWECWSLL